MAMKQSASVEFFARQVLGDDFQEGVDIKTYITKDQTKEIVGLVTTSVEEFETEMTDESRQKYSDHKKLRNYVSGMVTNWFNKSKKLNGGIKFEYKNPGSRPNQGDAQLRELKKLRSLAEACGKSAEDLARVDEAIAERQAALAATKAAKVEVKADAIPEHLRDLLSA